MRCCRIGFLSRIGAGFEKDLYGCFVSVQCGPMEGRVSKIVVGVDIRFKGDNPFNDIVVSGKCRIMESCPAAAVFQVYMSM